jgi:hypothetical protein
MDLQDPLLDRRPIVARSSVVRESMVMDLSVASVATTLAVQPIGRSPVLPLPGAESDVSILTDLELGSPATILGLPEVSLIPPERALPIPKKPSIRLSSPHPDPEPSSSSSEDVSSGWNRAPDPWSLKTLVKAATARPHLGYEDLWNKVMGGTLAVPSMKTSFAVAIDACREAHARAMEHFAKVLKKHQ